MRLPSMLDETGGLREQPRYSARVAVWQIHCPPCKNSYLQSTELLLTEALYADGRFIATTSLGAGGASDVEVRCRKFRQARRDWNCYGSNAMSKKAMSNPTRLPAFNGHEGIVHVVIETEKRSRNKFSYDEDLNIFPRTWMYRLFGRVPNYRRYLRRAVERWREGSERPSGGGSSAESYALQPERD